MKHAAETLVGKELETSYGRRYRVLAGPFVCNNSGVVYATKDLHDEVVELKTEDLLEGLTEVK